MSNPVRLSPSNLPTNGRHATKQQAKEQRFTRNGVVYVLVSAASGVALSRAVYAHNPASWERWLDVCKDGGHDPFNVRQKWQVKEWQRDAPHATEKSKT